MEDAGDKEGYEIAKRILKEKCAELLSKTAKKISVYKEPDGSFSYCQGYPAVTSQGMHVCIPHLPESDVNANALARGSRTMTLRALDIAPGTDARIDAPAQTLKRGAVEFRPMRLHDLLVPVETEPAQIVDRLTVGPRFVAGMIKVFHPKKKPPAARTRAQPGDHECPHVAEVKRARRTRRQTAYITRRQNFFHSAMNSLRRSGEPNACRVA
jgi:hypothetical protein